MFFSVRDGRWRPFRDGMWLMALASLGTRSPRTVGRGRQPASRVLRCAAVLRMTAATDRAGSPCGPAGRLARNLLAEMRRLRARSVVAEHRRRLSDGTPCALLVASDDHGPFRHRELRATNLAHVTEMPTRCGSKQVPLRSIAQATLSRRSATERSARACPWPRLRSVRYLSWLTASRCAATRAQW